MIVGRKKVIIHKLKELALVALVSLIIILIFVLLIFIHNLIPNGICN